MTKLRTIIALLACVKLLTGCAFTPEQSQLNGKTVAKVKTTFGDVVSKVFTTIGGIAEAFATGAGQATVQRLEGYRK